MPLTETCAWFEQCDRDAAGMAAHPFHGVIPVCGQHATAYRIPLITTIPSDQES